MKETVKVLARDIRKGDFLTSDDLVVLVVRATHFEDVGKVELTLSNGSSTWERTAPEGTKYVKLVSDE